VAVCYWGYIGKNNFGVIIKKQVWAKIRKPFGIISVSAYGPKLEMDNGISILV
jgi:hypothetical protein